MMKRSRQLLLVLVLAAGCYLGVRAFSERGYAQTEQQPDTGPKPNVGETVIAPKKTQPSPATQPTEKKNRENRPQQDLYHFDRN